MQSLTYNAKKIALRAKNVARWNTQLVMLQSIFRDHEEINEAFIMIQSCERITNYYYLGVSVINNFD